MSENSEGQRGSIVLRKVVESDLVVYFEFQSDPVAAKMAAFTQESSADRDQFLARWEKILASPCVMARSIERNGELVGSVLSYEESGCPEITYWIGRPYWGQGVATEALRLFLQKVDTRRPMRGRAAKDNLASLRVLEKCGFEVVGESRGFANARGEEIDELELELTGDQTAAI